MGLSKWQVGLIIGTPVALGFGYWYLKRTRWNGTKKSESKAPTNVIKDDKHCGTEIEDKHEKNQNDPIPNSDVSSKTPLEQAQLLKNEGNRLFKAGQYSSAIKCYSEAIEVVPKANKGEHATYLQNRAAAFEQLKDYHSALKDCSEALELNTKYTKALHRRAKICEILDDLQQSLEDVTAVCILEGFQNQNTLLMADRVLKQLGKRHASEAIKNREPVMPSRHFIKTYFSSFAEDPIYSALKKSKEGDTDETEGPFSESYQKALDALHTQSYEEVIPACTAEINSDFGRNKAEALLLRGTFSLLTGESKAALSDLTKVIELNSASEKVKCNALIKRGSLYIQMENIAGCMSDYQSAAEIDPNNSDVYHHRGQINLLLERVKEAIEDFEKAVTLNGDFPIACVQKCYTDYRHAQVENDMGKVRRIMGRFKEIIKRFPDCSECYVLYAQVLSDQQNFDEADEYFKKAIDVDPEHATVYVHRGLLHLQSKGDVVEATKLISRAVEMDDKCDFGYETLGTVEVQRGNLERAIELFEKAIPLAKTEVEMAHLFSLKDAAEAQARVAKKLGIHVPLIP